jgi:hypothetical protein
MFPKNEGSGRGPLLTVLALGVALAGCSSMPWSGEDADDASPAPADTGRYTLAEPPSGVTTGQIDTTYEPKLEPITGTEMLLAEDRPNEYVVQPGDTLWDIASTFLKDPWYWPEIWYVNPDIENPHLIYPGDVLALVWIDGQPRLTTVRGSAYRLSPQARITPLSEAVTSIPYEQIAAFLSEGLVLEKDQLDDLPYILATRDNHLIAAAGNEVYVRGGEPAQPGTRYSVVHVGEELVDPDDNDVVGYQGIYVGAGALARGGDPATITLTETNREALRGDRLLPVAVDIPLNFFPRSPDSEIEGRIISVVDGVSQIGQYMVVVLNRGARDGLEPGHVLTVFQAGDVVYDRFGGGSLFRGEKVKLPDEEAGTVMVFKVYDRIAYGLVMEATSAIHVLDTVRNPI